jgi:hypothetical protein
VPRATLYVSTAGNWHHISPAAEALGDWRRLSSMPTASLRHGHRALRKQVQLASAVLVKLATVALMEVDSATQEWQTRKVSFQD